MKTYITTSLLALSLSNTSLATRTLYAVLIDAADIIIPTLGDGQYRCRFWNPTSSLQSVNITAYSDSGTNLGTNAFKLDTTGNDTQTVTYLANTAALRIVITEPEGHISGACSFSKGYSDGTGHLRTSTYISLNNGKPF